MRFNGTGSNPPVTESVGAQIARLEAENKKLREALETADRRLREILVRNGGPMWVEAKNVLRGDLNLIHDEIHEAIGGERTNYNEHEPMTRAEMRVDYLGQKLDEIMHDLQSRNIHLLSKHCWCSPTGHPWTNESTDEQYEDRNLERKYYWGAGKSYGLSTLQAENDRLTAEVARLKCGLWQSKDHRIGLLKESFENIVDNYSNFDCRRWRSMMSEIIKISNAALEI